jgi:hypothetical protein
MNWTEDQLTPWFDGRLHKPARPGVYMQRNANGRIGYQRWDGESWYLWISTAEIAAKQIQAVAHYYQNDDWRGLREPHGGEK